MRIGRDGTEWVGQTFTGIARYLKRRRPGVLTVAVGVALELGEGKRVVTMVPDSAERYLSKAVLE